MVDVAPKITHEFYKDLTTCSEHGNHSRLNNEHVWKDLHDHLTNT